MASSDGTKPTTSTTTTKQQQHPTTHKQQQPSPFTTTFRLPAISRATLPPIPNESKHNHAALPPDYMFALRSTTLERNNKFRILLPPPDLDMHDITSLDSEHQARAVRMPHQDDRLLRRDALSKSTNTVKHPLTNKEKTWLLKTVFLNVAPFAAQRQAERVRGREGKAFDELSRVDKIERQFDDARDGVLPPPPKPGAKLKSSRPLLPARGLSGVNLIHVKFPANETLSGSRTTDDAWATSRSLLVRRPDPPPDMLHRRRLHSTPRKNEYDPLVLYMPKRLRSLDEDDIFADEDEGPEVIRTQTAVYDSSKAVVARDYAVRQSMEKNQRMVLVFGQDKIEYAVLMPEVLMLTKAFHANASTIPEVQVQTRALSEEEKDERQARDVFAADQAGGEQVVA